MGNLVSATGPHVVEDLNFSKSNVYQQWCDMHLHWLHKYTLWEEADQIALDNPQASIYDQGGKVMGLFAGDTKDILAASIAVVPVEGSKFRWEIVKFAVIPDYQSKGMGGIIFRSAVSYCTLRMQEEVNMLRTIPALQASIPPKGIIQMDSSSKLVSAVRLYQNHGFKLVEDHVGRYVTADIFLELEVEL